MVVLDTGTPAPGFCLPDKNNTEICLNIFTGKWVVLYFYPKDNTPGCTTEAKGFNEEFHTVIEKYGAWRPKKILGREILGIVRTTYIIGPDGIIHEVWPHVKVTGHADAVKKRLEELQASSA